jgi:hypothetical protein
MTRPALFFGACLLVCVFHFWPCPENGHQAHEVAAQATQEQEAYIGALQAEIETLTAAREWWRRETILLSVQRMESDYRHDGIWGDEGESYGRWQFQLDTFNDFKKASGMNHWNWTCWQHQDEAARWAFDNGFARRWTAYRVLCDMNNDYCWEATE